MPAGKLTLPYPRTTTVKSAPTVGYAFIKPNRYVQRGRNRYRKGARRIRTYGLRKGRSYESNTLTMSPFDGTRITSYELTQFTPDDTTAGRQSNTVLNTSLFGIWDFMNTATTARYVRMMILGLRGGETAGDTTNWTDILTTEAYVAQGAGGTNIDVVRRVNKNIYICYYDKTHMLPGTADGQAHSKRITVNKKLNVLSKFAYNSNQCRQGTMWILWYVCEDAGTPVQDVDVNVCFSFTNYFKDAY